MRAATPPEKVARNAGLVYVSGLEPGFNRRGSANRFRYFDARGRPVTAERHLRRIARLAIPPAYTHVWICRQPQGHIQATGRDARGRKQYRYHPEWRNSRDHTKFARMVEFGSALPALRRRLKSDLRLPGLPREKVIALIVSLLDATYARVGNADYAKHNHSYGLTTLRDHHLKTGGGKSALSFRGKNGTLHEIEIPGTRLARLVRRCQELPGQQLFQYVDEEGARHAIGSSQVNAYLHDATGMPFTAKDFRTWAATLHAAARLAGTAVPEPPAARACKQAIAAVVNQVAEELRNTPAVCRKSYINPALFIAWETGLLHRLLGTAALKAQASRTERRVLQLLKHRSLLKPPLGGKMTRSP